MDIEALIESLEALNDVLTSKTIRESDDFQKCVKRFQAKLADLFSVYKSEKIENSTELKTIITDLKIILEELDKISCHDIKVFDFVKDIAPKK